MAIAVRALLRRDGGHPAAGPARCRSRTGERVQAAAFLGPALLLLGVGLIYPAILTVYLSLLRARPTFDRRSSGSTTTAGSSPTPSSSRCSATPLLWVVLTPLARDRHRPALRRPRRPGALRDVRQGADLHADGDLARRRVDHLEVRLRLPSGDQRRRSACSTRSSSWFGVDTDSFLLEPPWNTLFLIVVMIWIQAGFAMVILSAAIKAHPGRHRRGRPPRRRQRAGRCSAASRCRASGPSLIVVLITITSPPSRSSTSSAP